MLLITIFKVSGHSMEPTLHAGQFVLVSRWATPKVGDIVVANDAESYIRVIKRVKEVGSGKWKVGSDNKGHGKDRIVNKSQVVGKVIWH